MNTVKSFDITQLTSFKHIPLAFELFWVEINNLFCCQYEYKISILGDNFLLWPFQIASILRFYQAFHCLLVLLALLLNEEI